MIIKSLLKSKGITVTAFGREIGVNKVVAWRIANGQRFKLIGELFQRIYRATGLTPNEILNIPDKKEGDVK